MVEFSVSLESDFGTVALALSKLFVQLLAVSL
jgi:hypothetical protein